MSASVLDALGLQSPDTTYPPPVLRSSSLTGQWDEDILRLHHLGKTQDEIATACGCAQATVSRTLHRLGSTVDIAAKVLEAKALPAALRVVDMMDSKNDRVVLEASKTILGANNLLGESKSNTTNNIQVVIGMPSLERALGVNLHPDTIDAKP